MGKTKTVVQKGEFLQFLKGHKKADEFIKVEKRKRLSQLTMEDSLQQYDALCGLWDALSKKEGLEVLEKQRLSLLLERRRRFDRTGRRAVK